MFGLLRSLWGLLPTGWIASRIRYKLLLALLAVSLIPLVGLGVASFLASDRALTEQAASKLEAVRTLKAGQVEAYFELMRNQVATVAENRMTVEALEELARAFRTFRADNTLETADLARLKSDLETYYTGEFSEEYLKRTETRPEVAKQIEPLDDDSIALQHEYIRKNENPLGKKQLLDQGTDLSKYSVAHGKYHPIFRSFLEKFGYYDIFLVDLASSDIVYTVFKELDFSTNLRTGPYATTNIGRAFRQAAETERGVITIVDYEPYTPSYADAASFLATPVYSGDKKIGVLIFQIPIDRVNAIMAERTGLGETGETYAVGPDFLFRNDSRFREELAVRSTVLNPKHKVVTANARQALAGQSGTGAATNYRGQTVLASWEPIQISDATAPTPVTWALLTEVALEEVSRPATTMFWFSLALIGAAAVVVIAAALLLARSLTRQADAISGMLSQVGMGMFDARADILTQDELGLVATSLNSMCDNTLSLIQSQDERDRLEDAVSNLKTQVSQIATGDLTVRASAGEGLTADIAGSISKTAEGLSAGSADQARQIQSTSAAVARMAVAIQAVSTTTQQSAEVAGQARESALKGTQAVRNTVEGMERIRDQVQDTSKRIKRLGETSQEIGEIVQLIGDIADRTSILALNASIQAAMAGEAGQGFAVVAEEVERLADRANEATKRIGSLIKSMQTETAEAMAAMEESTREVVHGTRLAHEAGQTLGVIDTVSNELAQRIRTISEATREQAASADSVARLMTEISQVTTDTSTGTRKAAESIHDLAELSTALRDSVSRFRLSTDRSRAREDDDPTAALGRLVETALET